MKKLVLSGKRIITGAGSLKELEELPYERIAIVTGGQSMIRTGVIEKAREYLGNKEREVTVFSGVPKNPSFEEVQKGIEVLREFKPDCVLAIGGGSAMDCAKAMLLFYEFPFLTFENVLAYNQRGEIPAERSTALICVPSTSGTGSEVTRGTVITDTNKQLKVPIMTDCLRPDIAILDPEITMTMPAKIAAETGMDALTHAIEAYTNHNLDDFDASLCAGAIKGIMEWLPESCEKGTIESREKIHNYQAMAGIGFANVGLGMVHGIAHSFGAAFDMAHGLTNAIILPYVLSYNSRDEVVKEKLEELSYLCHCEDIVKEIRKMRKRLGIPACFLEAGITEQMYQEKHDLLLDHAMLGATNVNPVKMTREEMEKMLVAVVYGKEEE
ncbi:alcohol dehydrogenase [Lachnospiraceae bacterium KM106-2]|nr:alcohol dehydrogenase [Lachnospiraceae bacterium KM106-2]